MTRHLIGIGRLSWNRNERISDRYGCVHLYLDSRNSDKFLPLDHYEHEDAHGKLIAVVLETRQSPHIGDLFHGFFPETPNVGEEIVLGEGTLFWKTDECGESVGLEPDDGRDHFWLDPWKLYRCHSQTVEIYFEPTE